MHELINSSSGARKMGVRIYEQTEVIGIKGMGEKTKRILTDKGEFETSVVVDAAGAWAGEIAKLVGLDIPIWPSRRHIFVTEALDEIKKDSPLVIDFRTGFWFRREGPGLIFGMRRPNEAESFNTSVDWNFLGEVLAEVASHRLPLMLDVGIMDAWAGLHADTPDFQAIVGKVPEIEGLFLACGFSGHGFMHSPAVGRIIAELILGKDPFLDIAPLSPERFKKFSCQSEKEKVFI